MADDQRRRSSWPWRKLKLSSITSKSGGKSSHFSPSQLASPGSSFKTEGSARFLENSWKQEATCSSAADDARRAGEAVDLKEKAEESLRALKEELSTLIKELTAKEALVKQHQKVADEAVSGWEKAEKEILSLKQELEAAAKKKAMLEDRITQLDGALKECMRKIRHVKDEQEVTIQEFITCKTRELAEVRADMEAKQAELQRSLIESDAQNSAMAKSLQERAWRVLEANEAKSKTEAELKVMQVKMAAAEKDISSLQYELHLLSKELEIRNEEVAYCKKSADAAHKQHLDNVQKVAKLEADCQRLRILVKKKLPGPAAIAQMRKEVEGLPVTSKESASAEFRRRPINQSYASSTISFSNSHQRVISSNSNRDVDMLRERLISMEEENKLLKEALSKRIGELQSSWLLCAKTASKLSIAEDHLESLQGTPRDQAKTDRSFDFTTTGAAPSIASVSDIDTQFSAHDDVEEASCAESWASALIGELAHFKREKIVNKEAIKEVVTEPYSTASRETSSSAHVGYQDRHAEENCSVMTDKLPVDQLHYAVSNEATTITSTKKNESGLDVAGMRSVPTRENVVGTVKTPEGFESDAPRRPATSAMVPLKCQEDELKLHAYPSSEGAFVQDCDANGLGSVLSKLITLLELLPRSTGDAMLDADCAEWNREKQALQACSDRFLLGQASVIEILVRVGKLVCRVCHVGSEELEHMLASSINSDKEVSVNAAGFLSSSPSHRQVVERGADRVDNEISKHDELDADGATIGAKPDELKKVTNHEPRNGVGDLAAGGELKAAVEKGDADVADTPELDAQAACMDELDADVASKHAAIPSQNEELTDEEAAMNYAELGEAQAELSHYKKLYAQLETKNEELQQKLQGLEVEDDDCNASSIGEEGIKQTKTKESDGQLVEAKEKLAECERTMLDLGKQLHALSSGNARSLPPQVFFHDYDEPLQRRRSRQRGLPSARCHVVSGPQDGRSLQRPASAHAHEQMRTRHLRYTDADHWLQQLDDQDGHESPPLSAMSSPARSPGRYTQQVSGRTRAGSGVRTSLTESLNAAANKDTGSCKARPRTPSAGTSSFGRLFSRSKNHW